MLHIWCYIPRGLMTIKFKEDKTVQCSGLTPPTIAREADTPIQLLWHRLRLLLLLCRGARARGRCCLQEHADGDAKTLDYTSEPVSVMLNKRVRWHSGYIVYLHQCQVSHDNRGSR